MAVAGIPHKIEQYGGFLRRVPEAAGKLPEAPVLGYGPLSAELASVQNPKADNAFRFASAMDAATIAAGDGLIHIAMNLEEFDRQGANAIARLFPDWAPGSGGGP